MSTVLKRGSAILAVIAATVVFATAGLAQMPPSPWKKAAPFPEPDEELYGVAVNGKLYVIGGWGDGKARGANYEYDPATDKWTKKKLLRSFRVTVPALNVDKLAAELSGLRFAPRHRIGGCAGLGSAGSITSGSVMGGSGALPGFSIGGGAGSGTGGKQGARRNARLGGGRP